MTLNPEMEASTSDAQANINTINCQLDLNQPGNNKY